MSIEERRERIKQLDQLLVDILRERFDVVRELVKEKEKNNMPVEDKAQEEKVLERVDEDLHDVFEEIMRVSKQKMQEELKL